MKTFKIICALFVLSVLFLETNARRTAHKKEQKEKIEKCKAVGCERQTCLGKKKWNSLKCKCECPKETKCYPEGATFDEDTCEWSLCVETPCPANQIFNKEQCKCICGAQPKLQEGYSWDPVKCEAFCSRTCTKPQTLCKESCSCECPVDMQDPQNYDKEIKQYNPITCQVECINAEPSVYNRDIKRWNNDICEIECINARPNPVPEDQVWDEENCELDCEIRCELPYAKCATACECICPPTNPAASCPGNQVYDSNYEICGCVCPVDMQDPKNYNPLYKQFDNINCVVYCINGNTGEPRDGYDYNDETCEYLCVRQCPGRQVANENCECECPVDMQDPKNYDPLYKQFDNINCVVYCINGNTGEPREYQSYDSETCTYSCNRECPGNQEANINLDCACECPNPQPSTIPSYKYWDDIQCKLVCKSAPQPCFIYNYHTWSEDLCKCSCPNEPTTTCSSPEFFSPKRGCDCVDVCQPQQAPFTGCPSDQYWCPETCQCECKEENIPYGYICDDPLKRWNNLTCECDCIYELDCGNPSLFEYNYTSCACDCIQEEEYPGQCEADNPLETWSDEICNCRCKNFLTERPTCSAPSAPKRWVNSQCACVCKTLPSSCNALQTFNPNTCECDCKAAITACPDGEAWDRVLCKCSPCDHGCVTFPPATTTVAP